MTIDEAIARYRKLAKLNRVEYEVNCDCYGKETVDRAEKLDCLKRAEEYEQIVEWLKEYKRLASKTEQDIYGRVYKDGYFFGYNNAIDDFAISIKVELNKFEVKNLDTCVLLDLMNRKAEKLKLGDKK